MSHWTTGDVIANGLRLHYTRTGGDKPPLVMAHGHSDNGLCWIRVAQALEAEYDCIMYDARRHGLSDDGPQDAPREAMAHDAAAFVRALGLTRPGMMGHSMGAATAAMTAALYPGLLGYIILEDPPWFDGDTRGRRGGSQPQGSQEALPQTRQGWVERCHAQNPNWHEDEVQAWADAKVQFHSRPALPHRRPRPQWQETAAGVACPALLLTGEAERGAIVSAASAQEALRLLRQGQVAQIAAAGHCIHRDQFEASMAAIHAFLAEARS